MFSMGLPEMAIPIGNCKECRNIDDDQLDDIVRYLREYPNSNALQISEELGIHPYVILKYMEEGWLGKSTGHFSRLPDWETGAAMDGDKIKD